MTSEILTVDAVGKDFKIPVSLIEPVFDELLDGCLLIRYPVNVARSPESDQVLVPDTNTKFRHVFTPSG
jgi:hypothetical protein